MTTLCSAKGIVKRLFDPACGTGGMLSVSECRLRDLNPAATLQVHGQELNARTYAICRSDMMTKGEDAENIAYGNSFHQRRDRRREVRLPGAADRGRGAQRAPRGKQRGYQIADRHNSS